MRGWLEQAGRRARPYVLPLIASVLLGTWVTSSIVARAGGPALPLDDSFIHLQFAKRLSQGHWFSYSPDSGYSTGATSTLWPLCIAPFFWLGLSELSLIWVVWAAGVVLHAAVALEAARLATRLCGHDGAGYAAGAMCFVFGAYAWFAYSGMETIALTWVLARGARVAAARLEPRRVRSAFGGHAPSRSALWLLALAAPMIRPEGVLVSIMALWVALCERDVGWRMRALGLSLPALAPFIVPSMHRLLAGHASSATAQVKWLLLDPYMTADEVWATISSNVTLLLTDLLNGGPWTWLFLPEGFAFVLAAGVVAMTVLALRQRVAHHGLLLFLVIAGTAIPTSYDTMLWNRVRYIWPFGWAWLVACVCLCAAIGELLSLRVRIGRIVSPVLMWGGVAYLSADIDTAVADVATSARAIDLQQVRLGRWARDALPEDAIIGVNDTGAIAYMSERRTFDVVGLTTEGEARYWAEGAGSRYEHYEQLPPARRPTHFIVYPGWLRVEAVLGDWLNEATVIDQSILGGKTMVAYAARYDLFGSGERPRSSAFVLDALDVADLASERSHDYQRGDARARFNVATMGDGIADGGRLARVEDRFSLVASPAARLVMRVRCDTPLEVWVGGDRIGEAATIFSGDGWEERILALPPASERRRMTVRPTERVRFDSWHYWLLE